ncbi:MAG: FtsX-like permease family protein [Puniceicoccales bacterium]|nr:FtsX-like permease family protein [Puniceicoccales bacterium]
MIWSLGLALRYLFPTGRKISFFTVLSILGVGLGVAVLWVVQSVINGFGDQIRRKLVDINGHIHVLSADGILKDTKPIEACLRSFGGIRGITPFATGITMVQHKNRVAFPGIRGLDWDTCRDVMALDTFVKTGQPVVGAVLLSRSLAESLEASVGDRVDLYSPLMLGALRQEEVLLPIECPVSGIFETGWAEIDQQTVLCHLTTVQELYGLGSSVHGLALSVNEERTSISALRRNLEGILSPPLKVLSWMDLNEDLLFVLRLEKTMMLFVVLFIVLVASFSIGSGLMTSVVRKRREIVLLTLMGAKKRDIAAIFAWQGLLLGVLGILFGFAFGSVALVFRNDLLRVLSYRLFPKDMLWNFYAFAQLPAHCSGTDAGVIGLATLGIALSASLVPAIQASRLKMAEVLRGE